MGRTQPRVGVVILNWRRAEQVDACLRALAAVAYEPRFTVVVDNGSGDGSLARLRADWPDLPLLATGANLGYAGGNNHGIRWALACGAEYLLVLNPDVALAPDALDLLVEAAEREPRAAALGPKLLYAHQPDLLCSLGGTIDWQRGCAWNRGANEVDHGQHDHEGEVDYLEGCALLLRRAALAEVGLFDPGYFMYWEDVDWCVRARARGWTARIVPQARAWHAAEADGRRKSPFVTYYMTRNRLRFFARHRPPAGQPGRPLARRVLGSLRQSLGEAARDLREAQGSSGALRAARGGSLLAAHRDFLLGRQGMVVRP